MHTCNSMESVDSHQIERVFFNFHDKLCRMGLRFTGPRARSFVEHVVLFVAVSAFCILILFHRTFVYRGGVIKSEAITQDGWNIPGMCLGNMEGFRYDIDVTHIVIVDSDYVGKSYVYNQTREHLHCGFEYRFGSSQVSQEEIETETRAQAETCSDGSTCQYQQHQQHHHHHQQQQIYMSHSFSDSKGYLFLEPSSLIERNITSQCAVIFTRDKACFSDDPILQHIARSSQGILDTIALNWILGAKNGTNGFIYHHKTDDLTELEGYLAEYTFRWPTRTLPSSSSSVDIGIGHQTHTYSTEDRHRPQTTNYRNHYTNAAISNQKHVHTSRWHHNYLVFKAGVVLSTLFLFFLTTTVVSFTLRETQDRMLYFTLQLKLHIQRSKPYVNLIVMHVIENMVFVPIMIGIIFFLMDCFYNNDRLLAFIILSGVWICEVFSAICMRTIQSSVYFPRVFFAYFTLFHIYYFSCPFGFFYAALSSTVLFQLHSMLFFWNRYELPAIVSGQVSRDNPRMVLFAHPVVQTTLASSPPSAPDNRSSGVVERISLRSSLGSGTSHPSMSGLGGLASVLPSSNYYEGG